MKLEVLSKDLYLNEQNTKSIKKSTTKQNTQVKISRTKHNAQMKLDVRGLNKEQAIDELEQFISDCLINGFSEVVVVHGYGSGVLKNATIDFLKQHNSVSSFEYAKPNQGGLGVSIVRF
jgi:DNA mismatch repair protein MutS2